MTKYRKLVLTGAIALCVSFLFFSFKTFAYDRPFNNGSNWGGTGLMEIPTARVLDDGHIRVGYARAEPFRWITAGMGIFPGLELSGRYTEVANLPSGVPGDFGAFKDKAFDLKYQFLAESKWLPALAIGLHDFHGTAQFPAEYFVLSRQIYPFDFTVGWGSKRLKGALSILDDFPLSDNLRSERFIPGGFGAGGFGLFGGIEWAVSQRFHLLAEYNPIDYEEDKTSVRGVPEGASWPVNIGLRANLAPGVQLGVSYQRGDTLGFMCHVGGELGKPISPKNPDPPLWVSEDRTAFAERDLKRMTEDINNELSKAGFSKSRVYTDGKDVIAEFENTKYISTTKAVGRVLRILLFYSPEDTDELVIVLNRRQLGFLKVSVNPDHMEAYLTEDIPDDVFQNLLKIEYVTPSRQAKSIMAETESGKWDYRYGIKPAFSPFFAQDTTGIIKFRAGIKPYVTATPWSGGTFFGRLDIPLYSDIESGLNAPVDAVRSDSGRYSGNTDMGFDRITFSQALKIGKSTYAQASAGYFDLAYAGIGSEFLTFIGDGNLALGLEAQWVRKRAVGRGFELLDVERYAVLGNIYYRIAPIDVTLNAKYGRFLGEDIGWRLSLSREYENGLQIGGWWSFTDTDHFTDEINPGYHDKGVFVNLPVRMFVAYETNRRHDYALSPWTRDVAQTVYTGQGLYGLGANLTPGEMKKNFKDLKK